MKTLLTLSDVILRRDEFTLQIDRLELLSGQIYLLHGPNGAGKSTLLHLLALLLTPQGGAISFQGIDVNSAQKRSRLRKQITLVEQNPFLFNTSVYENLAFGLRLRDVRGELQRRRITQALQAVDLAEFAERRAQELSGGETRRVALARAMILRPQLLLLDEPTAGLDREVLPIFERCLTALASQGTTVVIAGHDNDQHQRLGGELLCLERGRLIATSVNGLPCQQKETA
jgi:tungstate transport system ATP-binding protein